MQNLEWRAVEFLWAELSMQSAIQAYRKIEQYTIRVWYIYKFTI